MRVTGKLNLVDTGNPRWCLQLHNSEGCIIAAVPVNDSAGHNDAEHLAACWNAIESAGGSPAIVGELVAALSLALRYLEHPTVQAIPFACRAEVAAEKCRALLARVKGGAA